MIALKDLNFLNGSGHSALVSLSLDGNRLEAVVLRLADELIDTLLAEPADCGDLFDRLVNLVLEKKQNNSDIGYGYL